MANPWQHGGEVRVAGGMWCLAFKVSNRCASHVLCLAFVLCFWSLQRLYSPAAVCLRVRCAVHVVRCVCRRQSRVSRVEMYSCTYLTSVVYMVT